MVKNNFIEIKTRGTEMKFEFSDSSYLTKHPSLENDATRWYWSDPDYSALISMKLKRGFRHVVTSVFLHQKIFRKTFGHVKIKLYLCIIIKKE